MAEELHEKIYCMPCQNDNAALWAAAMSKNETSPAEMAALMNNGGGWNNNPFAYLIWLIAMRYMGGYGDGANTAENYNSRQIAQLQSVVSDNHNADLTMQAIRGNADAIGALATNFNTSTTAINAAICGVKSAVEQVGGAVGMTGQQVINSVLLGNKDLTAALQSCCCENKMLSLQNASAAQLQAANNQAATISRIDQLANGIQQGFAQVGYATQAQTCDILNASNANTQRIIDTLNQHWTADLQQRYNDARLELSQSAQNAYLISQLKTT